MMRMIAEDVDDINCNGSSFQSILFAEAPRGVSSFIAKQKEAVS